MTSENTYMVIPVTQPSDGLEDCCTWARENGEFCTHDYPELAAFAVLSRAADQRPTNDRLQGGCQDSRVSTVRSDAKPVSENKVADTPTTPIVRQP